jgi:hypothetical protein
MKTPNRKVRSAAQVAMSKTNPSEPDEPRSQKPQPVIDTRPRWEVLSGSIGPICKNCHQGIRSHFEGYCEPPPETSDEQPANEQELLDQELAEAQIAEEHPGGASKQTDASAQQMRARMEDLENCEPVELEPLPGSRLVDQALEIINLLPDCPEREILLRRCALAVSHQMNVAGFMLEEEME